MNATQDSHGSMGQPQLGCDVSPPPVGKVRDDLLYSKWIVRLAEGKADEPEPEAGVRVNEVDEDL